MPPELPEPSLGINFARDGMQRLDWLRLVAVHSDAWLMAVAFYRATRLNKSEKAKLFELMNDYPSVHEVLHGATDPPGGGRHSAAAAVAKGAAAKGAPGSKSGGRAGTSGGKAAGKNKVRREGGRGYRDRPGADADARAGRGGARERAAASLPMRAHERPRRGRGGLRALHARCPRAADRTS